MKIGLYSWGGKCLGGGLRDWFALLLELLFHFAKLLVCGCLRVIGKPILS